MVAVGIMDVVGVPSALRIASHADVRLGHPAILPDELRSRNRNA